MEKVRFNLEEKAMPFSFNTKDLEETQAFTFTDLKCLEPKPITFSQKEVKKTIFKHNLRKSNILKYAMVSMATIVFTFLILYFPSLSANAQNSEKANSISSSLSVDHSSAHAALSDIQTTPAVLLMKPDFSIKKVDSSRARLFTSAEDSKAYLIQNLKGVNEYKVKYLTKKSELQNQTSIEASIDSYIGSTEELPENVEVVDQVPEMSEAQQALQSLINAAEIKVNSEVIQDFVPTQQDGFKYEFTLEDVKYTLYIYQNPNNEDPIFTENADLFYQLDERSNGVMIHFQGDSIDKLSQFTWENDSLIFDLFSDKSIDIDRAKYAISRISYN